MAVEVHDRDGREWIYKRGSTVDFDEFGLVIRDEAGDQVGGFNPNAWTHYVIPADTDAVDPGVSAFKQVLKNNKR